VVVGQQGNVEIVDFKSGRLFDEEGGLLPEATQQLRLYGLIAHEAGYRSVQLFLEADERHSVPWGDDEREATRSDLQAKLEELPADVQVEAIRLARPGPNCRTCRLRPACTAYLDWAEEQRRDGTKAAGLPLDAWGRIERCTDGSSGVRIELRDSAGRLSIVEGIRVERGVRDLNIGEHLYFFELERTGGAFRHGKAMPPLNFHEVPPDGGKVLDPARRLLVFRA